MSLEEVEESSASQKMDSNTHGSKSPSLKVRVVQNAENQWTLDHPPSVDLQQSNNYAESAQLLNLHPNGKESVFSEIAHSQISTVEPGELPTNPQAEPKGRKRGRPVKYSVKDSGDEVAQMSIQELRDELKRKGLSPGKGYKHDLVARVRRARAQEKIPKVESDKETPQLSTELLSEETSVPTPINFPAQYYPTYGWDNELMQRIVSRPLFSPPVSSNENLPSSHMPKIENNVENVFGLPLFNGNNHHSDIIMEPQNVNPQ